MGEVEGRDRMNILIACEESQEVCKAFRAKGHTAYSCDIIDCSGGHPEWHIKGDVIPLLNGDCTFQTADTHTHTTGSVGHDNRSSSLHLPLRVREQAFRHGEVRQESRTLFWGAPKSPQMVTAAMKLKDSYSSEGKL